VAGLALSGIDLPVAMTGSLRGRLALETQRPDGSRDFVLLGPGDESLLPADFRIAKHARVARTFQNIRLFANMTALENVMVGRHIHTRTGVLGAVLRGRASRSPRMSVSLMTARLSVSNPPSSGSTTRCGVLGSLALAACQ